MKPEKPITRKEMYLDVATGGSTELPSPATLEEIYLAKIAGMSVDLPAPVPLKHKFLAKIAGMQIDVPTYTTDLPRIYAYLAKAAGQDVEIPQPVTREEMYWFDYCGGTPTPPEREYTGAVPVTFVADGTPLLDLLISGNEEHSGTPTPDSPVMPEGTGDRTGNLWDEDYTGISSSLKYVPVYVGNGSFTLSTSCPVIEGAAALFFLAGNVQSGASSVSNGVYKNRPITVASSNGYVTVVYRYVSYAAGSSDPRNEKTMLNTGSTPIPYEPWGIKIPISSASTTTPVYLGEVQTTRKVKKLVLTGEETIPNNDGASYNSETSTDRFVRDIPLSVGDNGTSEIVLCTHLGFQAQSWAARTKTGCCIYCSGSTMQLHLRFDNNTLGVTQSDTNEQRTAKLKSYLAQQYAAGTPVCVWYVLATEETAVVNEPLMRIGDYADTLSMEQAGVEIPTNNGSTTLDVETTVPPSEIYIKYRGEAVATLSMLSAEVSSPEATTEEENHEETEEEENGSEDVSLQHEFEAIE